MTFTIRSSIFLLVAVLAIIQANAGECYHTTGCRTFNLCPFTTPFDFEYVLEPVISAKFSFSLGTAITPTCNQTTTVWSKFSNNDKQVCSDAKNEDPAFTAVAYDTAFPGIVITYPQFEGGQGNLQVTLRCNKTAPHDTNVNFFLHKWENSTFYLTGYSYYGCPAQGICDDEHDLKFLAQ